MINLNFSLLTRIPYVKHTNFNNSSSAAKEASMFLETTCLHSPQSDKYREYCLI